MVNLWKPMPILAILVGPPGSCKTSFARTELQDFHVLSKDALKSVKNKEKSLLRLLDIMLSKGTNTVLDNCNVSRKDRSQYISAGRSHDFDVVAYDFGLNYSECVTRNNLRQASEKVPEVAIKTKSKQYQEPSYSEGFTNIFRVLVQGELTGSLKRGFVTIEVNPDY
jgi:predicted kinase